MDASPLLWSSASRAESNWRELSKMFLTTSFVLLMLQLFVCWCCGPGNSVKNYERDLVWLYWASMTVLSLFDALQSLYRLSLISLFSYLKRATLQSHNKLLSSLYWHNLDPGKLMLISEKKHFSFVPVVALFHFGQCFYFQVPFISLLCLTLQCLLI